MKRVFWLAALSALIVPLAARGEDAPAAAAAPGVLKIGYVNLEEVMRGYGKAEKVLARLERDMKEKEAETDQMRAEIKKLKAEMDLLSSDARLAKEEELMEKTLALKRVQQEAEQSVEVKLATERKKLEKEIRESVQAKAKALGYHLVLMGEMLLYKDPALDITKEILAELNKND